MPEGVQVERNAVKKLAGQAVGLHPSQPRQNVAQLRVMGRESDVFALPVDLEFQATLQVLDTTSANFGLFYFLTDYDTPGDPTKIIR